MDPTRITRLSTTRYISLLFNFHRSIDPMKRVAIGIIACAIVVVSGCGSGEIRQIPVSTPIYSATSDYSRYSELQNGFGTLKTITGLEDNYILYLSEDEDSETLLYFDKSTMKVVPVNSNPGNGCSCSNLSNCSGTIELPFPYNFQIYKEKIYYEIQTISSQNDKWNSEIWMMDLDGTNRRKLFQVEMAETESMAYGFFFREDSMYLFDQKHSRLLKYNLNDKKIATAADLSTCSNVGQFYQDENGIYVSVREYEQIVDPVLKINQDQSLEIVWENKYTYYADSNKCLYLKNGGIWFEKKNGDSLKLQDVPCFTLMGEDGFILCDDSDGENRIYYYDKDGRLLDQTAEPLSTSIPQVLTKDYLITRDYFYQIENDKFCKPIALKTIYASSGIEQ